MVCLSDSMDMSRRYGLWAASIASVGGAGIASCSRATFQRPFLSLRRTFTSRPANGPRLSCAISCSTAARCPTTSNSQGISPLRHSFGANLGTAIDVSDNRRSTSGDTLAQNATATGEPEESGRARPYLP